MSLIRKELYLTNGNLILHEPTSKIMRGSLHMREGKIQAIGAIRVPARSSASCQVLDVRGNWISPGFIDLHIHGSPQAIATSHVKTGTTGFLMGFHGADEKRLHQLTGEKIPLCLGVFCEGPFLNPDMRGAIPRSCLRPVDISLCKKLLQNAQYPIKIMTIAPELARSKELIYFLTQNKVIPSLGHTNATFDQAQKAIAQGVRTSTHCFNRMSLMQARDPGVLGAVLAHEHVYTEIVLDGLHVHPAYFPLLIKIKGVEKIILVTDNVECAPMPESIRTKQGFRLKNTSTLAGSTLTMNKAVLNAVKLGGLSLVDATRMASFNPATLLGIVQKKGSLAQGKDADVVVMDRISGQVLFTIIRGEMMYSSSSKILNKEKI